VQSAGHRWSLLHAVCAVTIPYLSRVDAAIATVTRNC
jgi:hypothetical protein